jgi:hypothetical protein
VAVEITQREPCMVCRVINPNPHGWWIYKKPILNNRKYLLDGLGELFLKN